MKASIIIPTYERPETVTATVQSVLDQSVTDYEVIVVDDGSNDPDQLRTLERLASNDRVTVLELTENVGPAAARNRGWRVASADPILFTDDDCLVPNNWVERLTDSFEPGVGAVGGPLLPTADELARSAFARLHRYRNEVIYGLPDGEVVGDDTLPMSGTANVAYRREALETVGGFDESFPTAAGEDADLQKRVVEAGYQMKYVPVEVNHNVHYDWRAFVTRSKRHGTGTYYYRRKHESPRPRWRVATGLLASPLYLPIEFRRGRDLTLAVLAVFERALSRFGELQASMND